MLPIAIESDARRSRALPVAMILFAVLAALFGTMERGASNGPAPLGLTTDQQQLISADANAGFPLPPLPDNPPRGPGA